MTSARISSDDIRSVFEVFDVDGTGLIDATELLTALRSLGWTKATELDVLQVIRQAHKDEESELAEEGASEEDIKKLRASQKEGLNFEQFNDLIFRKQRQANGPEEISVAFKLFDTENKGRINARDLKAAGKAATGREVPDAVVEEIMRLADLDKDGFLTLEEFGRAVTKGESVVVALGGTVSLGAAPAEKSSGGYEKKSLADESGVKSEEHVIAGVKVAVISGKLAKTEVRRALVVCGYDHDTLPAHVFDELFADADGDSDGLLTLDEYCKLLVGFGETVDGY